MRIKVAMLMMCLVGNGFSADPAPEPDYKALFLKANDSARKWKEQAEAAQAKIQELTEKLQFAEARAEAARKLEREKAKPEIAAQETAEKAAQDRADLIARATHAWVYGKITSVTGAGVIVKPLKSVSTEHRYTPYPPFTEECFVEMPTAGIYSDTILDVNVALIGDYDYETALHGHRQIPRTVCVGDNAAP